MKTYRLLVVADSARGGLGAAAAAHADWFSRNGWEVALAVPQRLGQLEVNANLHVVPTPASVYEFRAMVKAVLRLRSLIHRFHPDIVHCHGLRSLAVATLARTRACVTIWGPGGLPEEARPKGILRNGALRAVPFVTLGAFSDRPGFVGWEFLPHASPKLKDLEELPFPDGTTPTFLWVGRLELQKRADLFIRAVADAGKQAPMRAIVAGVGSLEPDLRRLAASLDAPVEFAGERADLVPLLHKAWAVVLLSRFEGVPLALQEAMWAGRVVVASRLPGAEWLVGDSGFLVQTVPETVAAMLALSDPDRARSLGRTAAQRVRSLLTPTMPWPALEGAYSQILR